MRPIAHRFIQDKAIIEKLVTIERTFFTDSPLDALKDYYSDLIAKLPESEDKAFIQTYVNLIQAR